jgi:hypothetical protein
VRKKEDVTDEDSSVMRTEAESITSPGRKARLVTRIDEAQDREWVVKYSDGKQRVLTWDELRCSALNVDPLPFLRTSWLPLIATFVHFE